MPYIGSQPTVGNFVKLDAIVTSSTATYNLLNGGVAYTPASVLNMIVSLNGVIQEPTTASNVGGFTVSGSTIIFTSSLTSADVIDFILVLGDVLNIGTPSDSTVTTPKLNLISTSSIPALTAKGTPSNSDGYIQLNCEQNSHGIKLKSPPHSAGQSYTLTFPSTAPSANTFLKTDGSGNLSFASAGGGTPYFSAKGGTYTIASATNTKAQYGTELFDSDSCYDTSAYRFTPTTAGYYHLGASFLPYKSINDLTYAAMTIYKNGSSGTAINNASLQRYDNSSAFMYAMGIFVSGFGYANGTSDYFEVFVSANQVGGGNVNVDGGSTHFFGYKVA